MGSGRRPGAPHGNCRRRTHNPVTVTKRPGIVWYVEKLRDNNLQLAEPRIAWKVFLAVAVTPKDVHDIYLAAIRHHLARARRDLAAGRGRKPQLDARLRLWSHMLSEEGGKDE